MSTNISLLGKSKDKLQLTDKRLVCVGGMFSKWSRDTGDTAGFGVTVKKYMKVDTENGEDIRPTRPFLDSRGQVVSDYSIYLYWDEYLALIKAEPLVTELCKRAKKEALKGKDAEKTTMSDTMLAPTKRKYAKREMKKDACNKPGKKLCLESTASTSFTETDSDVLQVLGTDESNAEMDEEAQ